VKRVKRRYLAVQLERDGLPSERELMDAIWGSLSRLFGEVGASQASLALISFDVERKVAVVRTSLVCLPSFRASLAAVTSVGGVEASLHVLAVSGTLKALFSNF
jgi:ribonuclease P/MRP protein subunit POP5